MSVSAQVVVDPLESCAGDPVNLDASGLAPDGMGGVNSSALQFGSGDYMRIPITAALSDFDEVTIEFWYYQISRGEEFIVATEYFNTGWGFHNENPNVMQWRVEGGPYSLGGNNFPIPYNQWMHVAGVYDGEELRLYVDGNLIASEAFSGPISDSRNEDIVVNRHVWASGSSSRLTGYLDELRISGVARYNDNFTPPAFDFSSDDQTLGLWHFDSSTGLMLDDSDYGHHGTSSGTGSTGDVPYASFDATEEPTYLWSNGMTSAAIEVSPTTEETLVVTVTRGDEVVVDSVVLMPDQTCCPGPGCCLDGTVWDFDLGGCVMEQPPFLETDGEYTTLNPCYFDSNGNGLVEVNDLMNLLSVYNLFCGELPEASLWQCGDPLGYQGYDYQTVQIGDQCWFAENLRSERYRNDTDIVTGLNDTDWTTTSTGAKTIYGEGTMCDNFSPDFDACDPLTSFNQYGYLYNWYAIVGPAEICPQGWHVPSKVEWEEIISFLGGPEEAGPKMRSVSGFETNDGNNLSGFNGLPGGLRAVIDGSYDGGGRYGNWWSSTPSGSSFAWYLNLTGGDNAGLFFGDNYQKQLGHSIRCIKDSQ